MQMLAESSSVQVTNKQQALQQITSYSIGYDEHYAGASPTLPAACVA
jgi:hypothetical protein